jgi:hypothetical protein
MVTWYIRKGFSGRALAVAPRRVRLYGGDFSLWAEHHEPGTEERHQACGANAVLVGA